MENFPLVWFPNFPQPRLMLPSTSSEGAGRGGRFSTTHWSVVLSSLDGSADETKARKALTQLCRTYWRPVFAYICRQGKALPDAQDLTQEFFVMILRGNFLQKADPQRGRFRALLLSSLQNFLSASEQKARAKKRGGEAEFISWDDWQAETPSQLTVPIASLEAWSPERIFDVRWAATIAEKALFRLQEECERRSRRRVFDALSGCLIADRADISYDALAQELKIQPADVKNLLHRMRQRYRQLLREEVAETVASDEEIEDELRYLVQALAAGM